jgi:hypothetical protein
MRTGTQARRSITLLLLHGILAACESPRAGENREAEVTPAPRAAERPDTPVSAPAAVAAERADTPIGAPAAAAAQRPGDAGIEGAVGSVVRIGVVDGDDNQIFGRIREIAVDDAGNVFVLDDQALKLSWFDSDGVFRGAAGRAGSGPGEFRAPIALALGENGQVHVLDAAHRRISTFVAADTAIALVEERAIPFYAVDFCRLGSRIFLLSAQENGVIHEIAPDGTILRSFGESTIEIPEELSGHVPLMRDNAARGRLVCASDPPAVVLVPEMISRVQAFDPDGALLWSRNLADYRQREWKLSPQNGVRMAPDPTSGSAHTAVDVSLPGNDLIAITLHEGSVANPEGTLELRTLSLADGSEREPRNVTGILAAVRHRLEYRYVKNPFPQITISPTATQR